MTKWILGAAAALTICLAAPPAPASAAPTNTTSVRLSATRTASHWQSHARFAPDREVVLAIYMNGRKVPQRVAGECSGSYLLGPLTVKVDLCEPGQSHINLAYVSFRPVDFVVRYTVQPWAPYAASRANR
jgi:hypothetical protein